MIIKFLIIFPFLYFISCEKLNGIHDPANSRFLQSKINVLTWLTNVIYPSETPKYFKKYLDYKGCREYFLKPSYEPIDLNKQWLQTNDWKANNEDAIIEYSGKESCRESNHPFPFGWLDNRMTTRTSLIKRDFFCKKTIAQLEVQINDAKSCGLIFRVIGERNYWGLIIEKKILKLIQVKDGELIVLKEFKELKIQNTKWYVLFIQEIITDIKVKAGEYGNISIDYLRKTDDESEYDRKKQGAVGLFANEGNCKFRNIIFRGKKWSTEYEKLKFSKGDLLYDLEEIEALYENTKDWCPMASLCSNSKYE
ncbi:conserved Plasmodium protein, unknown function [Plasmodium chabaudi chabaudi]|uniref:Uncharacterized protein n=1 Tax=Plasmodium chabaudi chabaudi TaxID=31271 RepID=A0A077TJZ6_PLACU|nr:conserved protein, unknown function [Plasmodium chabaudi chabaudi]SCN59733.1 conserved Plasmodium protein, unknown function [Plasmodium chabaudi chabaudi]VTZ68443.1 conserved protein, unknown function [Plasmodium chabaudi chabaudi]|eukprot:XP_016653813.1 conserved Plasmodium protein, unknown function [Plasmodium chabaudi chabaudi]